MKREANIYYPKSVFPNHGKKSITKHGDFIENDSQINAVDCHSQRWTD